MKEELQYTITHLWLLINTHTQKSLFDEEEEEEEERRQQKDKRMLCTWHARLPTFTADWRTDGWI